MAPSPIKSARLWLVCRHHVSPVDDAARAGLVDEGGEGFRADRGRQGRPVAFGLQSLSKMFVQGLRLVKSVCPQIAEIPGLCMGP